MDDGRPAQNRPDYRCEFARLFARDGYDLVLVARSQPELEKVAARRLVVAGFRNKIIVQASRILPKTFAARLTHRAHRRH